MKLLITIKTVLFLVCIMLIGSICSAREQAYIDYSLAPAETVDISYDKKLLVESSHVLQTLLKSDTYKPIIYASLARNYFDLDEIDKSFEIVKQAEAEGVDSAELYAIKSDIFARMGEKDEQLAALDKMVALDFLNDTSHVKKACVLLRESRYLEARRGFMKAIEINPFNVSAYYNLGLIALYRHQYNKAEYYIKKAATLDEKLYYAHNNLGVIALYNNQDEVAINNFKKAIESNEYYEIGLFNLARVLIKKGHYEKGQQLLERAYRINPKREKTIYLLGMLAERERNFDKAIVYFNQLVELFPQSIDYNSILAKLYIKTDADEDALIVYEKMSNMSGISVKHLVDYGIILEKKGKTESAKSLYLKAIQHNLAYTRAHYRLALRYFQEGNIKLAFYEFLKSGTYVYSSITIAILMCIFLIVVFFTFRIFFMQRQ